MVFSPSSTSSQFQYPYAFHSFREIKNQKFQKPFQEAPHYIQMFSHLPLTIQSILSFFVLISLPIIKSPIYCDSLSCQNAIFLTKKSKQ